MKKHEKVKVLIAEDDYLITEEITRILEKLDYHVVNTVSNGEQAIKMTQKLKPDVVLMDIRMPKLNGLEATKEIQRICPTPVVILTAYGTSDFIKKASEAGAGAYLMKPPKAIEIDRYITIAIARHKELLKSNELNKKLRKEIKERKKAQASLVESEKKYHQLFEDSPVALIEEDMSKLISYLKKLKKKGIAELRKYFKDNPEEVKTCVKMINCTAINKQCAELFQAKNGNDLLTNFNKTITDKSLEAYVEEFVAIASGEVEYETESEIKTLKGEHRNIFTKIKLKKIKGKKIDTTQSFRGIFDITERKELEEQLSFLSDITKQTIASTMSTDLDFKITWVNERFTELYGYEEDEIIGKTPDFLNAESKAEEIEKDIYHVISKGKTYNSVVLNKKKNGSIFHCGLRVFPLFDDNGEIFAYTSHQNDITKRIEAEKAIKESEQKFRSITSTAQDAIIMHKSDGSVLYWNEAAEQLFQYSKEDAIGKKIYDLIIPSKYMKQAKNTFQEFQKTGSLDLINKLTEFSGQKSDGKVFPLELSVSKFKIDDDTHLTLIIRDITQRKKAEADLKASNERLTILNKILRHDLANDFMVIQSAVRMYKRDNDKTMIDEIENRVKGSLSTIENYRKYERFISTNVRLKEVDIHEQIRNCSKNYPELKFVIKGKCMVFADETLESLCSNIISNAIKHGRATKMDISITTNDNMCEVRFADNGKGIPDKIKFKIFDEGFYYGKSGHTGIGLHIVKKTLQGYGGYIYAEDNKPKGAVIVIGLRKSLKRLSK